MNTKRDDRIKSLKEYYKEQKISVGNFDCKHKNDCSAQGSKMYRGSEVYIGQKYGEPFKVLVASLDRGMGKEDIEGRYEEIEEACIKEKKKLNPHMQGTLDALKVSLADVKVNEERELFRHYAMINTAKCCVGENMQQAPWEFFDNCKEFTKGEVDILDPDIIITQGRHAAEVFESLYPELKSDDKWYEKKGQVTLRDGHQTLVICAIHPSAANRAKGMLKKWEVFLSKRLPEAIKDLKKA